MTFGATFRAYRKRLGALRWWCRQHDYDPSTISKLERDILSPPATDEKLVEYAAALGLEFGSPDWHNFLDTAAAARRQWPKCLVAEADLCSVLPEVYAAIRASEMTLMDVVDAVSHYGEV